MARVKVTVNFDLTRYLDQFMDSSTVERMGNAVVNRMKEIMASGQSPVRGYGRFVAYKNPKRYPGKLKTARPVNLKLTGEMYDGLSHRRKTETSILVGMVQGSDERKEIAGYHNAGASPVPMRRFIPQRGEEFVVSIMRLIRQIYRERMNDLIARSNRK